jgi:hypothetical protein
MKSVEGSQVSKYWEDVSTMEVISRWQPWMILTR